MRGISRKTERGRRSQGSLPQWCGRGRGSHCLVKDNVTAANHLVGRGIVDEQDWGVKGAASKSPLPCLGGNLELWEEAMMT